MVINVTGNSFLWPLNTIYITEVLGKSMSTAGFVLMLQQAAGILGNLIGGRLFDTQGGKKTIIIGISMSLATVLSLSFFRDWNAYVGLMLLLGFSNGLVFPSMYAMAGSIWPEGGRKSFNLIYVSQNFGVALGSTLGGLVAQKSFTSIFLANAATFVIFLLLIIFGFKKEHWELANKRVVQDTKTSTSIKSIRFNYNLVALFIMAFAFVLTWMPYVQWQTSLSLYMKGLGIPLSQYTLLWTINGALIVLGQPLVSLVTKHVVKSTKGQMVTGAFIFALAFSILYGNERYLIFVLAMVIMTFAEMLVWPAVPAAAAKLAPEDKKGFYQGIVSSAGAAGRMLGFLVGGWLYDKTTINNLIIVMIVLFLLAALAFMNYDKVLKKNQSLETM